jgi:hypothetical protein
LHIARRESDCRKIRGTAAPNPPGRRGFPDEYKINDEIMVNLFKNYCANFGRLQDNPGIVISPHLGGATAVPS